MSEVGLESRASGSKSIVSVRKAKASAAIHAVNILEVFILLNMSLSLISTLSFQLEKL